MAMQLSASHNPPASPQPPPSHPSRPPNRLSGDMKGRAPLPVPSGPQQQQQQQQQQQSFQNGHSRNVSGFDMTARSPPNQSSKRFFFLGHG